MNFKEYPPRPWHEILPSAHPEAIDLVSQLVVFESGDRLQAAHAMEHAFFRQ